MTDNIRPTPPPGLDPRSDLATASQDWNADPRPAVARTGGDRDMWLIIGAAVLLGLLVLFYLGAHRPGAAVDPRGAAASATEIAAPPPPNDIAAFEAVSRAGSLPQITANPPVASPTLSAAPINLAPTAGPLLTTSNAAEARLKAPAMVVDLAEAPPSANSLVGAGTAGGQTGAPTAARGAGAPGAAAGPTGLNGDEQFAERVGAGEPERSRATLLHNLAETVPQGAMIPGVLETALDSDLPGYTRAVVSREVRGFDGTTVLIPRGSRVIGQYKSAVAQGQSRAFVIWTRILRPDGASIQIGSSGTDPLGRAGLAGSVNRHFLQQFTNAILLSVIDVGIGSLARQPSTQVVIGSAQQATSLAGSTFLPTNIPPTIKVPQGTPIRIFVARDLDFSRTGGVGQ